MNSKLKSNEIKEALEKIKKYNIEGEADKSLEIFEKLRWKIKYADDDARFKYYLYKALTYNTMGDNMKALLYGKKALSLAENQEDAYNIALTLLNMSIFLTRTSNYQEGIKVLNRAIKVCGDLPEEDKLDLLPACYFNRGTIYLYLGEFEKSKKDFENTLKIVEKTEDVEGLIRCYLNIGLCEFYSGNLTDAYNLWNKSFELAEKKRDVEAICFYLTNLADWHILYGDTKEAEKFLKQILIKSKKILLPKIHALAGLADIYIEEGRIKEAKEKIKKGLKILRDKKLYKLEGKFYRLLSQIENKEENLKKAIKLFEKSKDIEEYIPAMLHLADFYIEEGKFNKAKNILSKLKKLKMWNIRDILEFNLIHGKFYHFLCDYRKAQKYFNKAINLYEENSHLYGFKYPVFIESLYDYAVFNLLNYNKRVAFSFCSRACGARVAVWVRKSGIKRLIEAHIPKLKELQKNLKDEVLLRYYLSKDKLAIFCIDRENFDVKVKSLNIDLFSEVTHLISLILNESEIDRSLMDLWYEVINPVWDYVKGKKKIIIIPHKILHLLPFHILKRDRYLIDDFEISFAYSEDVFLEFKEVKEPCSILIILNPEFDIERKVVMSANKFSKVKVFEGKSVLELKSMLEEGWDIIHFSVHGEFDRENPFNSKLIISEDFVLSVSDIISLPFSSFVFLDACESGVPHLYQERLTGFLYGLLCAGANSMLGALWKIPQISSFDFVKYFYENMDRGVCGAVRCAMLKLREKFKHPLYWAPYIYHGR